MLPAEWPASASITRTGCAASLGSVLESLGVSESPRLPGLPGMHGKSWQTAVFGPIEK